MKTRGRSGRVLTPTTKLFHSYDRLLFRMLFRKGGWLVEPWGWFRWWLEWRKWSRWRTYGEGSIKVDFGKCKHKASYMQFGAFISLCYYSILLASRDKGEMKICFMKLLFVLHRHSQFISNHRKSSNGYECLHLERLFFSRVC